MNRTRIRAVVVAAAAAAALSLSTTSTVFAQRTGDDRNDQNRANDDQQGRRRGTYRDAALRDLPEKAQTAIRKYAKGEDLKVYRVTRGNEDEYFEATFKGDDGARMAMKVDRTGAILVPPTELPDDERDAAPAASGESREIENVERSSIPQAARQALGKEAEDGSDVDYFKQERGENDRYAVHFTKSNGQRMQAWVDEKGNLIGKVRQTRYQPEDRGDEQARARERDRNKGDNDARPAAARTGGRRGPQLYPLDVDQVPTAVERAFRKEADQNWDKADQNSVFRVGDNDYALQFQRGPDRYGMRVDREGKVVSPLAKIRREDRDPENPEREYFDPVARGEVPKHIQDKFRELAGKPLDEARDVRMYRVGEEDFLFRWSDDGRQQAVRIDRQLEGEARPYEIRDTRENRDRGR